MGRVTVRRLHALFGASFAVIALSLSLSSKAQQTQPSGVPAPDSNVGGVSGYVLRSSDRTPISGAIVRVMRQVPRDAPYQDALPVQTGPDGGFNFSGLADGSYSVVAEGNGFINSLYRFTVPSASGVRNELQLVLQQAGSISGMVYDEQNYAIQGVHVAVVCRNANGRLNGVIVPAPVSDDRGYFRASGLPASTCSLVPRLTSVDKSFASTTSDSPPPGSTEGIVVQAGTETPNVNLAMATGSIASLAASLPRSEEQSGNASISGHVFQVNTGAPLSGAIVELFQTRPFPPRRMEPIDLVARAAADGSYKFTSLPPGDFNLDVRHNGFVQQNGPIAGPSQSDQSVSLTSGQAVTGANVQMHPAGAIVGTIRDQDGNPVQGLSVIAISRVGGTVGTTFRMAAYTTTDDEGNFRLSVSAPNEYYVGAGPLPFTALAALGYHTVFYPNADVPEAGQSVNATVGGVTPELRLTVPRSQTYTVNVKITGTQAAGNNVYEISMDRPDLEYDQLGPLVFRYGATSRADGTAQLRAVLPGSYRIAVTPVSLTALPNGTSHATKLGPSSDPVLIHIVASDVPVEIPAVPQSPARAN
jgi:hypothetical protein